MAVGLSAKKKLTMMESACPFLFFLFVRGRAIQYKDAMKETTGVQM